MRVLDQETFFSELSKLYDQRKGSGSVWVSAKRTVKPIKWEKGVTKSKAESKERTPRCLVRATDGKKKKISCIVPAKDQARFQDRLFSTVRVHTEGMVKRARTRKKNTAS
uniref:Signal recognition particle 14 kDa protein n=1 Tax=Rhodosorus marinus TaxID=101924 RepID=A0A7S3A2N9_9RHOD|mmetsp:Transcript_42693/g.166842  ORF Transcript_42693/g.166842 Transcript_42693/m.166842 type:complete len:110 (+) Transcript_42693:251-580(+)